jgi:DNA-binding MarR family transcriptional regulator
MPIPASPQQILAQWHRALAATVRDSPVDLTTRQLAILLSVYVGTPPHTVRGLAAQLGISKPAVTRALDRLEALGFVRRRPDPADKRSIVAQRTVAGSVYLSDLAAILARVARDDPR